MKRFPVTSFNIHNRSVSPSEQPDRPGFRANFSRWGPGRFDLKPHPSRAVLKLPKTHSIRVSSGFDYLRTDQMFGPMPLLDQSNMFGYMNTEEMFVWNKVEDEDKEED